MLSDSLKEALAIGIILSVLGSDLLYFVVLPWVRESETFQMSVRTSRRISDELERVPEFIVIAICICAFLFLQYLEAKRSALDVQEDAHTAPSRELVDEQDGE